MATKNLVAAVDGVLIRVGNTVATLYQGGGVPDGADEAHVDHLKSLGLLVPDSEDVGTSDDGDARALGDVEAPDAKSTAKKS